jgi:hypothetical protein
MTGREDSHLIKLPRKNAIEKKFWMFPSFKYKQMMVVYDV